MGCLEGWADPAAGPRRAGSHGVMEKKGVSGGGVCQGCRWAVAQGQTRVTAPACCPASPLTLAHRAGLRLAGLQRVQPPALSGPAQRISSPVLGSGLVCLQHQTQTSPAFLEPRVLSWCRASWWVPEGGGISHLCGVGGTQEGDMRLQREDPWLSKLRWVGPETGQMPPLVEGGPAPPLAAVMENAGGVSLRKADASA